MKVKSFYSCDHDDKEVVTMPSQTIPDQSLSVRDILMRFTRGQMDIPPIETGDDDDFDSYESDQFDDFVDAQEAYLRGHEQIESIRLQSQMNKEDAFEQASSSKDSPGSSDPVE